MSGWGHALANIPATKDPTKGSSRFVKTSVLESADGGHSFAETQRLLSADEEKKLGLGGMSRDERLLAQRAAAAGGSGGSLYDQLQSEQEKAMQDKIDATAHMPPAGLDEEDVDFLNEQNRQKTQERDALRDRDRLELEQYQMERKIALMEKKLAVNKKDAKIISSKDNIQTSRSSKNKTTTTHHHPQASHSNKRKRTALGVLGLITTKKKTPKQSTITTANSTKIIPKNETTDKKRETERAEGKRPTSDVANKTVPPPIIKKPTATPTPLPLVADYSSSEDED
eukprot:g2466.t1